MEFKTDKSDIVDGTNLTSNAPLTHADESFTLSMVDQMFHEVENQEINNNSSLSLIDLETVDSNEVFMADRNPPITPIHNFRVQPMIKEELAASPIPASGNVCFCVSKTPAFNPKATSYHSGKLGNQRSFSGSSFSCITAGEIVASTPFHQKPTSSLALNDVKEDGIVATSIANRTYNFNEPTQENNRNPSQRPLDATYDGNQRVINATFTTARNPINDATFNMTTAEVSRVARADQTFEIAVDRVPERGPTLSLESNDKCPPSENVDAVCTGEPVVTSMVSLESVPDRKPSKQTQSKKENSLRKPLSALNNAAVSRLKPPASSQSNKKLSRLQVPKTLKNSSKIATSSKPSTNRDKNISTCPKPVNQYNPKPKPTNIASRKSLLPPPTSKLRAFEVTVAKKTNIFKSSLRNQSSLKATATPKNTTLEQVYLVERELLRANTDQGKLSKVDDTSVKSSVSTPGVRSGVALSSLKPSSKAKKAQVVREGSASSLSSVYVSFSKKETRKSRGLKAKSTPTSRSSVTKSQLPSSHCAVAMAVLLDYVVNKVNGLSAPKLFYDKERLQSRVKEQTQNNADLSSRINELEAGLTQARESRDRDVAEALERHKEEVEKLSRNYQDDLKKLSEELQSTNRKLSEQERRYDDNLRAVKDKHNARLHELTLEYEEEIRTMSRQWAEERQEIENATLKLQQEMDGKVEKRAQELIRPYAASHEENKSLRAVLDMRNDEQQKLLLELSQRGNQIDEARALQDHMVVLQQKNEDLQSQIDQRILEHREVETEANALRRQLAEHQSANRLLTQRVEELSYRLHTASPSLSSSFNPIFTPSPSALTSNGYDFDEGSTPVKSRTSDSYDVTPTSKQVNGCT